MPQRFLKPGITSSKKWESCSWMAQSFYVRLITLVDDFGRYEADASLLRSHAFPRREDIRSGVVVNLCKELAVAELVIFYESNGKEYLQLTLWTERTRADKSKFPEYTPQCKRLFHVPLTNAAESCGILPSSSPSPSPSPSSTLVVSDEPTPASATTDEQWLAGLKADKGYEGLDVDREYARMKRWCVENKKQPTRRRFINWLNRCDKPLASNGATETKPQGIWALTKQLEAIEEQITKIKRRGHEDAFGVNIQEQDKPEYKRLCAERKRLKEAIAKGGA